ncbi:MAG: hypothetical protein Q4B18_05425, partial [Bacillota bacterium]|nr:hypothetical protein [Bacillota bacterium]
MGVREGKKRRTIVIAVFVLLIFAFISIGSESHVFAETATGTKVTYKGAVSSMGSTCGKFTIKGHYAFCAEHSKPTPPTGTKITST